MSKPQWVPHRRETWPFQYATLKAPVVMEHYLGHWEGDRPVCTSMECPAGTAVRIVMVSRFGDVGITERLQDETGYGARVQFSDLTNLRDKP